MIAFDWLWAFGLLPLPWLFRWLLKPAQIQQEASLHTPFIQDYTVLQATQTQPTQAWLLWALALVSWLLLVTAVARPQWVGDPIELPFTGRDIMLAVDLSGSMQEQDYYLNRRWVNRLTATKVVAGDFIQRREGDRIGLILFGDRAYLQTPLTFDRQTVHTLLLEAQIGFAGKKTAIGDAIGLAVKRLQKQNNKQPILILLTDGSNTAGEVTPSKAADLAQQRGIKIYTIGMGGLRGGGLDVKTLKSVAKITNGRFFRANDTQALAQIYQLLDALEPVEQAGQIYRPIRALFTWPLSLSLLCAIWLLIYRMRRTA